MIQLIKFETIDGDSIYINENAIAGFCKIDNETSIIQLNMIGESKGIEIKTSSIYLQQILDKTLV